MEIYFLKDHVVRTCATAYPNFVTKSQNTKKSCNFSANGSSFEEFFRKDFHNVFEDFVCHELDEKA